MEDHYGDVRNLTEQLQNQSLKKIQPWTLNYFFWLSFSNCLSFVHNCDSLVLKFFTHCSNISYFVYSLEFTELLRRFIVLHTISVSLVKFIQTVVYLNSSFVLFSVKYLTLLHLQLSLPWTAYTTSTTRYNFSMDTNELSYVWMETSSSKTKTKSVEDILWSWYRTLSDLFFIEGGLVKGGN